MTLTKKDFDAMREMIQIVLDEVLDQKLEEKIPHYISHLPTKDEFYEETGKILKEIKDMKEELMIVNHRSSENRDKIEKLENIHPQGEHATI